jgi:threonylcarbamoyladenosine tRNA methylthiotransferase MtaB
MNQPRLCHLATLGCKVNQYETQHVKEILEANGYREARSGERADLCIINTCTVTNEADAQGRQLIRKLGREHPGAAIVVMGCYATREPETLARLPGVVKVIPDKIRLGEELRQFGVRRQPLGISRFDGHQRAFVKVQDGCLLHCTFCIIPQVRPTLRSRPMGEIVEEVARLVDQGYREIVLTGIHLGHYGIDLSRGKPPEQWSRLWHLLDRLGKLPGDFRVRLSSLEAAEVRDDLVRALANNPRVCPHLHLCLQSGSDRVLAQMGRRYRSAGFLERCRRLRAALDQPAFSTDVIVGFPGESDADFEETCRVVREVGFVKIHVFPFSPRRGTPAAEMPDRVSSPVVAERRAHLAALEQELHEAYLRSLIGRKLQVLVEGAHPVRPGWVRGMSCRYVPVQFPGWADALIRRIVPVRALNLADGALIAHPEAALPEERLSLPLLSL